MAHKPLQDSIADLEKTLEVQLSKLKVATQNVNQTKDKLSLLNTFAVIKANDYIETTLGRGTVLSVEEDKGNRKAKVFLGQGASARIVNIMYYQFKGIVNLAEKSNGN